MARITSADPVGEAKLLLVEGQDDKHVVRHFCNRHPEIPDFYIQDRDGINGVLASIDPDLRSPGRQAVGIVVDMDDAPDSRWNEVAAQISRSGFQLAAAPDADGMVVDNGQLRVGVWLMPNNQAAGELEDFVSEMIPDGDPVWPRAQCYINKIPNDDRKFAPGKTRRAQLHSWLAACEDPRQMGLAIHACDLAVDGELCQAFVAWLTRLFA